MATRADHIDIVTYLLRHGAKPDARKQVRILSPVYFWLKFKTARKLNVKFRNSTLIYHLTN